MQSTKKRLLRLLLFAVIVCGTGFFPSQNLQAAQASLSKKTMQITVGTMTTLRVRNTKKKVKWKTNRTSYIRIIPSSKSAAILKAKKTGTANVYAIIGKKKLTCQVTIVEKSVPVTPTPTPDPTPEMTKPTTSPETPPSLLPIIPEGNLTYSNGVTTNMCTAAYWSSKQKDSDRVLLSLAEIQKQNQKNMNTASTNMYDLINMPQTYNPTALKQSLGSASTPTRDYYINGIKLSGTDKETYFENMRENILQADTVTEGTIQYGLCTHRAEMRAWPTADTLGYSAADADDELLSSAMNVNEPFIIKAVTADKKFYWGMNTNCSGWVEAKNIAICHNKEEWSNSWTGSGENILVVTTNQITLAASNLDAATSGVTLHLGTELNLIPKEEIPESLAERGTWNNYVVSLPTRDADGYYVKKAALISQHYTVSVGYLPLTQKNLLDVAFACLGDRYGWGGMLGAMDCSLYTRSIYKCFGMELPRNTTWQCNIPTKNYDLSGMTDTQKEALLDALPVGTLLFFPGHITMYIGKENGVSYVISATGSLSDDVEETKVQSMYSVIVNTLHVKRRNGTTWLNNITAAICPWAVQAN